MHINAQVKQLIVWVLLKTAIEITRVDRVRAALMKNDSGVRLITIFVPFGHQNVLMLS